MTAQEFFGVCSDNGIALDEGQRRCFLVFVERLLEWNVKLNLISRRDIESVWEKHAAHSVAILLHANIPTGARVADVGTGGGFPGIPLKIARPDLSLTLIDSVKKKITAVDDMIASLKTADGRMTNLDAVCGRAEELAVLPKYTGKFDVVVSRAVAPLVDLIEWVRPMVKQRGRLLSLKGGALTEEIAAAKSRVRRATISATPLTMQGVPSFVADEKQLVTVQW